MTTPRWEHLRFYERPSDPPTILVSAPRLESWDSATHPDQVRLRSYLVETAELVADKMAGTGQLTLDLVVGLPRQVSMLRGGHDLDNYLRPLVRHLGPERFAAVFARKIHSPASSVAITAAALSADDLGAPNLTVRTTGSAESTAWKRQIFAACRAAGGAADRDGGPLALVAGFGVSSRRNWTNLWKPAIDSLGPVLGIPDEAKPFHPNDDRIVELAMHRTVDDNLGHDVLLCLWWWPIRGPSESRL